MANFDTLKAVIAAKIHDNTEQEITAEDVRDSFNATIDAINAAKEDEGAVAPAEWGNITGDIAAQADLQAELSDKVDKEAGKGLSENDYTDADKAKLDSLHNYDDSALVADIDALEGRVQDVEDVIPAAASPSNQLADKAFVNSSVATNTANYISDNGGPFTSLADLEAYSGALTNNDYAFVVGTDAAGNTTYTRYKYNASTGQWAEEYVLNNSSFTASQWAAINSGITGEQLSQMLAGIAAAYVKPQDGIPASDLASGVQTSLGKADTAVQPADLPTVPTISTDIETDAASDTKTASPKAVYDYVGNPIISLAVPTPNDGTVIFTHLNGDTTTMDLNHVHLQYYAKTAQSSQPVGGFQPDEVYALGTLTGSVTFALASAVSGNVNHYFWTFETGASAPTVTWPAGITWADGNTPAPGVNKHCEVSILGGVGIYMEA